MAKKKTAETANIKAAPVLRVQGDGEQLTPETPVITKSYSVRDDWKDKGIVNYVTFKSVDGEVQDLTVNGEPAGGGGGATATVLITNNNSGKGVTVRGPIIYNNMIMADMYNDLWTIEMGSSDTFTVPLASDGIQVYIDGIPTAPQPVITGGCTWDADDQCFFITSDCTITI